MESTFTTAQLKIFSHNSFLKKKALAYKSDDLCVIRRKEP